MECIKNGFNELELIIHDTDTTWLNTLRRIMISEVPSVAIETVFFEQNRTTVHDEFLSHRLGLVPLSCDSDTILELHQNDFSCEFLLEKENKQKENIVNVYSTDLIPVLNHLSPCHVVSYPNSKNGILLCRLGKGEKLKLKCKAMTGTGKDHIKWSPVSSVYYFPEPQETFENDKNETFRMSIETNGSISASDVFKISLTILKKKINSLQKILFSENNDNLPEIIK